MATIFLGGGGSKKCYNDRNLYTPNCNKVVIEKKEKSNKLNRNFKIRMYLS